MDTKEKNMRLTKRQLKRIIREEYSRLKRRGLIREAMDDGGFPATTPKLQPQDPMNQLSFFVKNIVYSAGWETMLRNLEMYDRGAFVDYCDECGCSSDEDFVRCALEYAEGMTDREIDAFTDYIAHYSGRY